MHWETNLEKKNLNWFQTSNVQLLLTTKEKYLHYFLIDVDIGENKVSFKYNHMYDFLKVTDVSATLEEKTKE